MSVSVVVTMTSTVGIEGLLLGKPLVTIDTSVFREDAPYSAMGLSLGVTDLDDLESALDVTLDNTGNEVNHGLAPVGLASQKIFDTICELNSVTVNDAG